MTPATTRSRAPPGAATSTPWPGCAPCCSSPQPDPSSAPDSRGSNASDAPPCTPPTCCSPTASWPASPAPGSASNTTSPIRPPGRFARKILTTTLADARHRRPTPTAAARHAGTTGAGCATTTSPPTTAWPSWPASTPPIAADLAHQHRPGPHRVDQARSPTPPPSRCIYGDGTLVRPIYAPPATRTDHPRRRHPPAGLPRPPHRRTATRPPPHRFDPDLQPHHGRLGPVLTHGYVAWHARGPAPYQRVVLAVAHIAAPGQEAATAVALAARRPPPPRRRVSRPPSTTAPCTGSTSRR